MLGLSLQQLHQPTQDPSFYSETRSISHSRFLPQPKPSSLLHNTKYDLIQQLDIAFLLSSKVKQMALQQSDIIRMQGKHQLLIKQGDENQFSYAICKGSVFVFKRDSPNIEIPITSVTNGKEEWNAVNALCNEFGNLIRVVEKGQGLIGDESVVHGEPASATIITRQPCQLLRFNSVLTDYIYSAHKKNCLEIMKYFRQNHPRILNRFSTSYLMNAVKYMTKSIISPGSKLLTEGIKATAISFMMSGNCMISKNGYNVTMISGKEIIGIHYINQPSQFTYTTLTYAEVIKLKVASLKNMPDCWLQEILENSPSQAQKEKRSALYKQVKKAIEYVERKDKEDDIEEEQIQKQQMLSLRKSKLKSSQKYAPKQGEMFFNLPYTHKVEKYRSTMRNPVPLQNTEKQIYHNMRIQRLRNHMMEKYVEKNGRLMGGKSLQILHTTPIKKETKPIVYVKPNIQRKKFTRKLVRYISDR